MKNKRYYVIHQQFDLTDNKVGIPFVCTTTGPMTAQEAAGVAEDVAGDYIESMADDYNLNDDAPGMVIAGYPKNHIKVVEGYFHDTESGIYFDVWIVPDGKAYREYFWVVAK